jgi:hypothetical protein
MQPYYATPIAGTLFFARKLAADPVACLDSFDLPPLD